MRGVFQQERYPVAADDRDAAVGNELRGFDGRRQRERNAGIKRVGILARNGLEAEMFAVPEKWPARLESIEEIKIGGVAAVGRADRELDAVHNHREGTASLLGLREFVRQQIKHAAAALTAEDLRRDLHEVDHSAVIEIGRQILVV